MVLGDWGPDLEFEGGQPGGFVLSDVEHAIESGDFEDFADLGAEAAEFELSGSVFDFFVQGDQFIQRGAGHELDGVEVQQEHIFLFVEDQSGQFITETFDGSGVHDFFIDEVDDMNAVIVHHIDTSVSGHRATFAKTKIWNGNQRRLEQEIRVNQAPRWGN
jgi:hypothetical protein